MRRNGKSKNLIWILAVLVLLTVLSAVGVKSAFPETLALEQSARCGLAEHVHGEECYVGDILVCREKMHTHGQNCYLVLLEDNDINELLARVDATEDNSLETLISFTVLRAAPTAQLNTTVEHAGPVASVSPSPSVSPTVTPSLIPSMTPSLIPTLSPSPSVSPSADPESTPSASPSQSVTANQPLSVTQQAQPITNRQIAALNAVSDTSVTGVVLNEHLTSYTLSETATEEQLLASLLAGGSGSIGSGTITVETPGTLTENPGVSTLAVGDAAATNGDNVNIYIYVDGNKFICLGSTGLSQKQVSKDDKTKYYAATATNIANLFTGDALVTSVSSGNTLYSYYSFKYYRGETTPTKTEDFVTSAVEGKRNDTQRFGFSKNSGVHNALLYDDNLNSPINFYTVTLDYSTFADGTDQIKYVQDGLDSGLSPNTTDYDWYTSTDANAAALTSSQITSALSDIDEKTTLYAKPKDHTVTFNSNGGTTVASQTVKHNGTATEPTAPTRDNYNFRGWYTDVACTKEYSFDTKVTQNFTLYAKWVGEDKTVNLTYKNQDGEVTKTDTVTVPYGDTFTLNEAYIWSDGTNTYENGDTVTITDHTNFVGTVKTYTIIYTSEDNDPAVYTLTHGAEHEIQPVPAGCTVWVDKDGNVYTPGDVIASVEKDYELHAVSSFTVEYLNEDGTDYQDSEEVIPGNTVTLPKIGSSYRWVDQHGNAYTGETVVTVTENLTFTLSPTLTINYNVNFPSSLSSGTLLYPEGGLANTAAGLGVSAVGVPKINKNINSSYTTTITYADAPHIAEALNYREVFYMLSSKPAPAYEYRSVYFLGWQATVNGQTELFEPGEAIDWAKLNEMAGDSGTIAFTGLWEDSGAATVTFYVNYAAEAANAEGNFGSVGSEAYTPEVFCGHLFGVPSGISSNPSYNDLYGIAGANAKYSAKADEQIRALYGNGVNYDGVTDIFGDTIDGGNAKYATTLYMTDFPDDADVLARIKFWYANGLIEKDLKYDDGTGEKVYNVPYILNSDGSRDYYDLDTDHYTIRWYVFKSQDDGWHVDGRLIKKTGVIKITKNFEGNESLVQAAVAATAAKGDDYVFLTAVCDGYYDMNGNYVEYAEEDKRSENLYFRESKDNGADHGYRYDAATDTYSWIVSDVNADEKWVVTEYPVLPDNSLNMEEWIWVDSYNGLSDDGLSLSTTVTGITHAADAYNEDWLVVNFRNVYHLNNTILIRKVDGNSLDGLPGAVFNLWQVDKETGEEKLMHFTFDSEDKVYEWDQYGTGGLTDLTVNENGFLEYTVQGFTYDEGYIIVREKTPPGGYGQAPDVTVGYTDSDTKTVGILGVETDADDTNGQDYYAEYANAVLTVKNYSANKAEVTAKKEWECDPAYYDGIAVRMELLANGQIASVTIPGFNNLYGSYFVYLDENGAYFTLKADGTPNYLSSEEWEYTWTGLPAYIGGQKVNWSLRETLVGKEVPDAAGNFPNWIVSQPHQEISNDGHGTEIVTLTISNTPRRAMLYLTKYDNLASVIPGAEFTLTQVDDSTVVRTGKTDDRGRIIFDNLKYETWYTLTETMVPAGYLSLEGTVYVKLANTGAVTVTTDMNDTTKASQYIFYPDQANNVVAVNYTGVELPATGGSGTLGYTLGGALLMAAALLMLYQKSRRKEDAPYV